jgi:hypothetical protein
MWQSLKIHSKPWWSSNLHHAIKLSQQCCWVNPVFQDVMLFTVLHRWRWSQSDPSTYCQPLTAVLQPTGLPTTHSSITSHRTANHSQQYYSPQDCQPLTAVLQPTGLQFSIHLGLSVSRKSTWLAPFTSRDNQKHIHIQKHLGAAEDRNILMAYTLLTFLNYVTNAYQ